MNADATSLNRLHDIIVPAPVPWWPPAPGWYWILGIVVVLLLLFVLRFFVRWQHNRYRREALAELERQETALKNPEQRASALLALSELLKRTAMTVFPREQIARLTGPDWFGFLDRTAKGATFSAGLGVRWQNAIYDPRTAVGLDEPMVRELTAAIRSWIKNHQSEILQKEAKRTKAPSSDTPSLSSLPSVQKPC